MSGWIFLSLNARSLYNKIEELQCLTRKHKPLLISIQETWCQPHEPDSLYSIDGYLLFRRDRHGRSGGGVATYYNTELVSTSKRLTDLESDDLEDLWTSFTLKNTDELFVHCSIYRPPNSDLTQFGSSFEATCRNLKALPGSPDILITGDFNAHSITWYDNDTTDDAGDLLAQLFSSLNFSQLNSFPTHIHQGQLKSCIDLIVSNNHQISTTPLSPIGKSDHLTILGFVPGPPVTADRKSTNVWCWSKANIAELKKAVRLSDWSDVRTCINVNHAWNLWRDKLLALAKEHIPQKLVPSRSNYRPWISPQITLQVKEKHRLFKVYKRQRTAEAWTKFKAARNEVTAAIRQAKSEYVLSFDQNTVCEDTCNQANRRSRSHNQRLNVPRLHEFLRCFTRKKDSFIPDLLTEGNPPANCDADKADTLNKFFVQQAANHSSQEEEENNSIILPEPPVKTILTDLTIEAKDVRKALRQLDVTKSPGSDGIPTRLLKLLANEITAEVHFLFSLSVSSSTFPDEWKLSTVAPIFKGRGSRQAPTNYRPISLLCILSKVLERLVYRQLYKHLDGFLPTCQSGFRQNDSASLQLSRLLHQIAEGLELGNHAMVCFFDLSKAFDRVWHHGLLMKLSHLGIQGNALAWLENYLTGRQQRVRVNGHHSSWLSVTAGVPQGSVLGPLLFIAYTSDLPLAVTNGFTETDLFADDTMLTSIHPSAEQCVSLLQESIKQVTVWLSTWHLSINATKTVIMKFGRRSSASNLHLTIDNDQLREESSQRHLGLYISSDLHWRKHIETTLAKATPLLGVLSKLRSSLSLKALSTFYLLYIRPVIEYSSVAFVSLPCTLRDRLETFQRRAAKIILGKPLFQHYDHDHLLTELSWPTLDSRRRFLSTLLGHALAHGSAPNHLLDASFPRRNTGRTLRTTQYFQTPIPKTCYFSNSPLFTAATLFNNLPLDLQNVPNAQQFRKLAKEHILTSHCPCNSHIRFKNRT